MYMFFNDKENTMELFSENGYLHYKSSIGDSFISFMNLDLSYFEECRVLVKDYIEDDYNLETEEKIKNLYPNTYANLLKEASHELANRPIEDWIFYFILFNTDIKNQIEVYEHPYLEYSETCQHGFYTDLESLCDNDFNLESMQETYKELLEFCFDIEYNELLNKLTAFERFYLYRYKYGYSYFYFQALNYEQIMLPFMKPDIHEVIKNSDIDDTLIDYIKAIGPYKLPGLTCGTPKDMIVNEFQHMLTLNIKMKKCKNCGLYFVLKGDYNTDYCDRVLPEEKFTCKKIAAINARKEKINNNPILKEYEKAYKRNYAKRSNKRISNEDFRLWIEEATQKRDSTIKQYEINPSNDLIIDFKKYLGNK